MILQVEHTLQYTYDDFVSLNPHYLYLSPKASPFQHIIDNHLVILPKPDLIVKNLDQEGNIQHLCYINQLIKGFEVISKFTIRSQDFNSFEFVFFPFTCSKIPFKYPSKYSNYVDAFFNLKNLDFTVKQYAQTIAQESGYDTIDFLMNLCTNISSDFNYESRERGDALKAEETLNNKSGSCRDFSVLMIETCAAMGILARFVSGYLYGSNRHEHEMHAWVEVLLPGGGWRGFDPTEGCVVDKNYIALAASVEHLGLTPIRGTFRSSTLVESKLETNVIIKPLI